jgi:catechol 2,3-dioxygenase-like lactoylglutathione lyase family enzyme
MRALCTFVVGIALGSVMTTGFAEDRRLPGVVGINHVALVTPRYEAMKAFYTQTMGFPEVFTARNASGEPTLTYLQASRTTFIELFPAAPNRAAGFQHVGLHVDDIDGTVARLRERGVTVSDARTGATGSRITTVTDPDGTRIELSELGPQSRARQASEAWK